MGTEVEHLCGGRVWVGVGWVIAVNPSPGDRKTIFLLPRGIPPTSRGWSPSGYRVDSFPSRVGFSLGGKREDAGLHEVLGLRGKSGYLCPLVARSTLPQKPFSPRKGPFSPRKDWKEPGKEVAGLASAEG